MSAEHAQTATRKPIRWWPAGVFVFLCVGSSMWVWSRNDWTFQQRNLAVLAVVLVTLILLLLWWLALSRAPWRWRVWGALIVVVGIGVGASLFRVRGFSGDVLPVFEARWSKRALAPVHSGKQGGAEPMVREVVAGPDFPQFLGPNRTAMIEGPALDRDWRENPPRVLWHQPIGAAWSGWAIVGGRAFTQEQRPEGECVTCYDALTGELVWCHADEAHYQTALAGEGPRCTPTVVSNRVFTLGATGILNCLQATDGKVVWSRNIVDDARSRVPEWGIAGSPLMLDGKVVVSAGGAEDRSLLAYRADNGELAWSAGSRRTSYSSPFVTTLVGRQQILEFNSRMITAHEPDSGKVLWEYPWGNGQPQVSEPVVVGTNRALFSCAYGVGSVLLEVTEGAQGRLDASRIWQSRALKSKFGSIVQKDGFVYGLDDGVLVCVDLKDGAQRWRGERYGHGQGLLIKDLLVLMAENGELVLVEPAPESPRELHRFRVFGGKTWNPVAVSGPLLLARTEKEAVCLRLKLESGN